MLLQELWVLYDVYETLKKKKTRKKNTKLYVFFPPANANVQFLEEDMGRHDSNSNTNSQNDM